MAANEPRDTGDERFQDDPLLGQPRILGMSPQRLHPVSETRSEPKAIRTESARGLLYPNSSPIAKATDRATRRLQTWVIGVIIGRLIDRS